SEVRPSDLTVVAAHRRSPRGPSARPMALRMRPTSAAESRADEFAVSVPSSSAAEEQPGTRGDTTMSATTWTSGAGAYADVNGINLYYETHGAGRPLVLLHGGLGSGEMFGPILPALCERHQVIAPDLQGHGRTADIDRPLDVRL